MRRREFIRFVGGTVIALPFTARAQQAGMPIVGFLHSASAGPYASEAAAFVQGLKEMGFVDGQNVAIEYRWAEGRPDRLPALASDLVGHHVAVIAAVGGDVTALPEAAARQEVAAAGTVHDAVEDTGGARCSLDVAARHLLDEGAP